MIDVSASPLDTEFKDATLQPGSDPHIAGTPSVERPAHQR